MTKLSDFTYEEKKACLPVIDLIMDCANTAKQYGVLALEEWIKGKHPFLAYMLTLVVDGTDPELVTDIGKTLIDADDHKGSELLSRMIMLEGILSVQAGENPRIIEMKLLCMLGERFLMEKGIMDNPTDMETKRRYNELTTREGIPGSETFNATVQALSDREIQFMLRETDQNDLCVALKGASGAAGERIMMNLSKRLGNMILEEMEHKGTLPETDILAAQGILLDIVKRLTETGEITG
jgi:hypothetical protein